MALLYKEASLLYTCVGNPWSLELDARLDSEMFVYCSVVSVVTYVYHLCAIFATLDPHTLHSDRLISRVKTITCMATDVLH